MNYGVLTFIENTRVTDPPSLWTHKKQVKADSTFRFMPPYDPERQNADDIEIAPSFRDDICLKVCTEKTVDSIASHAESAKSGRPFFIYLALTSPHLPHCAAPEFVGKSKVGAYGDFMLETDHRVGQVLDALDQHGLRATRWFSSAAIMARRTATRRVSKSMGTPATANSKAASAIFTRADIACHS